MKNNYFDNICGIQVCPSCGYSVKAGIIWPIGEEEYHACLSRKRTPVQVWYGSPYRGECSKEARRSPKPLGWVRFPTVPAIFLGVAQLAERVAWDHEAVRAGLTTQTSMGL